jgi:hypothetical protein
MNNFLNTCPSLVGGAAIQAIYQLADEDRRYLLPSDEMAGLRGCATERSQTAKVNGLQLQLTPNPSSDHLRVTTNEVVDGKWIILDMQGRNIAQGIWEGKSTQVISLNQIPQGNYYFRLDTQSGAYSTLQFSIVR